MARDVRITDECKAWFEALNEDEQDSIFAVVGILEDKGISLGDPYSSGIKTSRHSRMRELKVQHAGRPYRILYAFDPRRSAILLIGGDKTGNNRWYEQYVPIADRLYAEYLEGIENE